MRMKSLILFSFMGFISGLLPFYSWTVLYDAWYLAAGLCFSAAVVIASVSAGVQIAFKRYLWFTVVGSIGFPCAVLLALFTAAFLQQYASLGFRDGFSASLSIGFYVAAVFVAVLLTYSMWLLTGLWQWRVFFGVLSVGTIVASLTVTLDGLFGSAAFGAIVFLMGPGGLAIIFGYGLLKASGEREAQAPQSNDVPAVL